MNIDDKEATVCDQKCGRSLSFCSKTLQHLLDICLTHCYWFYSL